MCRSIIDRPTSSARGFSTEFGGFWHFGRVFTFLSLSPILLDRFWCFYMESKRNFISRLVVTIWSHLLAVFQLNSAFLKNILGGFSSFCQYFQYYWTDFDDFICNRSGISPRVEWWLFEVWIFGGFLQHFLVYKANHWSYRDAIMRSAGKFQS